MVAYSRTVLNQRATDLYVRIDRDGSGGISSSEAVKTARRLGRNPVLRETVRDVFGLVPRSGKELLRFVEAPPRQVAETRIFRLEPRELVAETPVAGARPIVLGQDAKGRQVAISPRGSITLDGARPEGLEASARAMDLAGELSSALNKKAIPKGQQKRLCSELTAALDTATTGNPTRDKDALFSGAMALMIALGRVCDSSLKSLVVDRVLWGLSRLQNDAMREFYIALAADRFEAVLDAPQRYALLELIEVTVRSRFPVDAWTENRTKPLRVSEIVHPEFWRRVVGYYRSRGFRLLSKNDKDTRRVYERVIKDPSGAKAPLKVQVEVTQGEDNLYAKINDPKLHVLVYDGHWQLGGNGTQSITNSPKARPRVPKLIVQDGCRTIQNYDELIDRHRDAMVIGSLLPIFVNAKPILDVIFEGIVRGESLAWVRSRVGKAAYFSRSEFRKLRQHADLDNDNRADNDEGDHADVHFDVYHRRNASKVLNAVESANTALFYHHDHEVDLGRSRSHLGRKFADHIVASGPIPDPRPGEVVRVIPNGNPSVDGKTPTHWHVQFNPAYTNRRDEEYAGILTAHVVMEIIRQKSGRLTELDRMRAIAMGATSVQFLGVYAKRGNKGMVGFLAHFGLPPIPPRAVIDFLEQEEGYGGNDQARAFLELVREYRAKGTTAAIAE